MDIAVSSTEGGSPPRVSAELQVCAYLEAERAHVRKIFLPEGFMQAPGVLPDVHLVSVPLSLPSEQPSLPNSMPWFSHLQNGSDGNSADLSSGALVRMGIYWHHV